MGTRHPGEEALQELDEALVGHDDVNRFAKQKAPLPTQKVRADFGHEHRNPEPVRRSLHKRRIRRGRDEQVAVP